MRRMDWDKIAKELRFSSAKSGGPGGQSVNKVNTKIILHWDIAHSLVLDFTQKERLLKKLEGKINSEGFLVLYADAERSQLKNKQAVIVKLQTQVKKALTQKKKRKPTKPGKAAKEKRLHEKKMQSEKKQMRRGFE